MKGRVYENGRSTIGWRKGNRIKSIKQVKIGDVLIGVSHQFKAENMYLVILSPYPSMSHDYQGFHCLPLF